MKKIAYISSPHFADCDLPLLHHLQNEADLTYILCVSDRSKRLTLINIDKINSNGGINPASDFPELAYLSKYIDLRKTYVASMPGQHDLSLCNLIATWRVLRFLLKQSFDLIHLTYPLRYGQFVLYWLSRKMIVTMHDPMPHSSEDTPKNRLHRWVCFKLVKNYILLNTSQKEEFISKYKLHRKNIFLSKLSIYTHLQDTPPQEAGCSGYMLFFGSINTHKGVDILCEAMRIVHTKHKDLKLIIAGKGKIYFDIDPYISGGYTELRNHYLTDSELAGLIRQSAFVACPYIDATQSGVVMSAFALGKPVIATNVGGLPEMIADGRYGLIIEPHDAYALAAAICRLFEEPNLLHEMSNNITADYGRGNNSWKAIAIGIAEIYSNLLHLSLPHDMAKEEVEATET